MTIYIEGKIPYLIHIKIQLKDRTSPFLLAYDKTNLPSMRETISQLYCPICHHLASSSCDICVYNSQECKATAKECSKCQQLIHSSCLERWIARYKKCPMCDEDSTISFQ